MTLREIRAIVSILAEWFSDAFVAEPYQPHRPLKIGIHRDLQERSGGTLSELEIAIVLRHYVGRLMYLRALVTNAPRVDLDGNAADSVTAAQASRAAAQLAEILRRRAAKRDAARIAARGEVYQPTRQQERA